MLNIKPIQSRFGAPKQNVPVGSEFTTQLNVFRCGHGCKGPHVLGSWRAGQVRHLPYLGPRRVQVTSAAPISSYIVLSGRVSG